MMAAHLTLKLFLTSSDTNANPMPLEQPVTTAIFISLAGCI